MKHRQIPGIAQIPQEFTKRSLPPIQSPLGMPPMQEDSGADDLAQEIYCRLAVKYLTDDRYALDAKPDELRKIAADARLAARCYFDGEEND